MSTIAAPAPAVKPARPFGHGLQRGRRLPLGPSAADRRWWAEQNRDYHSGPEPDWDAMAEESAALDAHERGLVFA